MSDAPAGRRDDIFFEGEVLHAGTREIGITALQTAFLRTLMARPDTWLSSRDLLERVWGCRRGLPRVRKLGERIRARLGVHAPRVEGGRCGFRWRVRPGGVIVVSVPPDPALAAVGELLDVAAARRRVAAGTCSTLIVAGPVGEELVPLLRAASLRVAVFFVTRERPHPARARPRAVARALVRA